MYLDSLHMNPTKKHRPLGYIHWIFPASSFQLKEGWVYRGRPWQNKIMYRIFLYLLGLTGNTLRSYVRNTKIVTTFSSKDPGIYVLPLYHIKFWDERRKEHYIFFMFMLLGIFFWSPPMKKKGNKDKWLSINNLCFCHHINIIPNGA